MSRFSLGRYRFSDKLGGGSPSFSTNGCQRARRLIVAELCEQNDEWQTSSRHMMFEAFARADIEKTVPILRITVKAA